MNGPKRELVRRLMASTSNMTRDQFRGIFPELASRENQARRDLGQTQISSLPVPIPARNISTRRIGDAPSSNGDRPRLRSRLGVALPTQAPVRMGRRPSSRQPVVPARPSHREEGSVSQYFRAASENLSTLEISINHVIQVVPSPRPRHNSADSLSVTPRRPSTPRPPRRRTASISSNRKRGVPVAVAPPPTVQSNAMECKICFDAQIQTVILPCGHACMCYDCSIKIQHADFEDTGRCPVCRMRMVEVKNIYFS